jgi:cytidylate kinase
MIIAVDGPAAAGKGTLGRALARHFGYHFLDTGTLYRMVGRSLLDDGLDPRDEKAAVDAARQLNPGKYKDGNLRGEDTGEAASIVAVTPEVRRALLGFQRDFARRPPGTVLDGRDIGTVVCPDADVKIFVTASPEKRAERRLQELQQRGVSAAYGDVLADIHARDRRDSSRATAPLTAAPDAVILDTSGLNAEEAIQKAIAIVESRAVLKAYSRP